MKKQYRIKRADEFQEIIKKRKSEINPNFVIYHLPKKETYPRIGISVGKKMGNAVFRNKAKRQIRMMMQALYSNEYSFDMIIIVRSKYFKDSFASNKEALKNLLDRIEKRRYANDKIK